MFDDMSPLVFGLYKIVKVWAWPLTWVWALLAAAAILILMRPSPARLKAARVFLLSGFVLLYGLSAGPTSAYLAGFLEQRYPPFDNRPGQTFDAIVVLTGDLMPKKDARPVTELTYASLQRTLCGADAFRQQLSRTVLLSGGSLVEGGEPDTIEMKKLTLTVGVPDSAILQEDRSRNTYESAKEVRRLLGERARVLLVTSAIHIPRAMGLFRKQGVHATPYPCGYLTHQLIGHRPHIGLESVLPNVARLSRSTAAINELVGIAVYRLGGKL